MECHEVQEIRRRYGVYAAIICRSAGGGANVYGEERRKGRQIQEDARRDVEDEENWAVVVMWSDGDNARNKCWKMSARRYKCHTLTLYRISSWIPTLFTSETASIIPMSWEIRDGVRHQSIRTLLKKVSNTRPHCNYFPYIYQTSLVSLYWKHLRSTVQQIKN